MMCAGLTCPKLMTPANGHVEVTGYKIGSTAIFSCNDDYTLNGQATLRCGPGRWLGTAPSCSYGNSLYSVALHEDLLFL